MSHDAQFCVVDGDSGPLQRLADGAVYIYLRLLVGRLGGVQSGLGEGERALCVQRIETGLRSQQLFLFGDVESLLGKVARFLGCIDVGLSLLKCNLVVGGVHFGNRVTLVDKLLLFHIHRGPQIVVHNLGLVDFGAGEAGFDWAVRFGEACASAMLEDPERCAALVDHPDYALAVPTPDHFLPLAPIAGLAAAGGTPVHTVTDGYVAGALSMAAYRVG